MTNVSQHANQPANWPTRQGATQVLSFENDFKKDMKRLFRHDSKIVTIFGSSRIRDPKNPEYAIIQDVAFRLSKMGFDVLTGSGPGLMEAGNRGAMLAVDSGVSTGRSIGIGVNRIFALEPSNQFVTESYGTESFEGRLGYMIPSSGAFVVGMGGYGTMHELFEVLTREQYRLIERKTPIVILTASKYYEEYFRNLMIVADHCKFIDKDLLHNIHFSKNPADAANSIKQRFLPPKKTPLNGTINLNGHDMKKIARAIDTVDWPSVSIIGTSKVKSGEYYRLAHSVAVEFSRAGFGFYTAGSNGISTAVAHAARDGGSQVFEFTPQDHYHEVVPQEFQGHRRLFTSLLQTNKYALLKLGASDGSINDKIILPGGASTRNFLYQILVEIQTGIIPAEKAPKIVLMPRAFWKPELDWLKKRPLSEGMIRDSDLALISTADAPREALSIIKP